MLEEKKLLDLVSTFRMSFVSIVAQKHFFCIPSHVSQPSWYSTMAKQFVAKWKKARLKTTFSWNTPWCELWKNGEQLKGLFQIEITILAEVFLHVKQHFI